MSASTGREAAVVYDSGMLCRSHSPRSSGQHLTVADLIDFLRRIKGMDYGVFDFGNILDTTKMHRQVNSSLKWDTAGFGS